MKETFKAFKLEDGMYFEGYTHFKMLTTDKISLAHWFGYEGNRNPLSTDDMKHFKGKFVTVTISDDEQPTFNTVTVSKDEQPTFDTRKEPATFKGKIAMIKREQKLSEEALSNMLGCGKSTVHDWLHGSVPSRKFRKKIEELYKSYYEE